MINNNNKKTTRRSYIATTFVSMCLLLCAVRCLGATDTATIEWSGTRPPTWMAHATTPAFIGSQASTAMQTPWKCPDFHSMGVKSINGTGMSQLDRCRDIHTQGMVLPGCWTFRLSSKVEAFFEDEMDSPIALLQTKGRFTQWARDCISSVFQAYNAWVMPPRV